MLPAPVTKEKKDKDISMSRPVREQLLALPKCRDHDYVVTQYGKPLTDPHGWTSITYRRMRKS